MKLAFIFILIILSGVAIAPGLLGSRGSAAREPAAISQQAYVWQRAWTPALRDAVQTSAPQLSAYIVLGAELSFKSGRAQIARVSVDYPLLKRCHLAVGIAMRVGPYRSEFAADDEVAKRLMELAASLLAQAKDADIAVAELQIDFDCADFKLDGYRAWVEAIGRKIAPVPVTITVLPSWLKQPGFTRLARATAGYVLQVHSLQRPQSLNAPMTLCDSAAACQAVEQAGRVGVPFRVALPTYGYLVAFNDDGIFEGLSAEGPGREWSPGTQVRTLSADPAAMADLVAGWMRDRPACMTGIIWYRLPAIDDTLNWRWATLKSVMAGRTPRPLLHVSLRKSAPGLFDVELQNDGEADAMLVWPVTVRWQGASLLGADAIGGFDETCDSTKLTFVPSPALATERLAPGDRRGIGWLRLSDDKEVHADVLPQNP